MGSLDEMVAKRGKVASVEATMSKAEYVRINLELSFRGKGSFLILGAMLGLTAMGLATANYWLLLPWLALAFLLVVNPYLAIRNALSRKNANFFLPCRYSFYDQGVSAQTSMGQGAIVWPDFVKWEKAAGYYVLHVRGRSFLAIPESVFVPADVPAFESLLRKKIGGK